MSQELKPCPFCGGEPRLVDGTQMTPDHGAFVMCRNCEATIPILDSTDAAVSSWNRRPPEQSGGDEARLKAYDERIVNLGVLVMEHGKDVKDAERYRFLCANPDWKFIKDLCRSFVGESAETFYQGLSLAIDERAALSRSALGREGGGGSMNEEFEKAFNEAMGDVEMPDICDPEVYDRWLFTKAWQASRKQALFEAATKCDEWGHHLEQFDSAKAATADTCAELIRELQQQ